MRVLLVTSYFLPAWEYGGPVRSVWNLARGLVHAGADVEVVTTDADPSGAISVPPVREEEGIRICTFQRRFPNVPKINTFYYAPEMASYLRETIPTFDIVNLQGLFVWPTLFAARECAKRRTPYVISLRGSLGRWGLRQKALKKNIYIRLVEKKTIDDASALHYTLLGEYEDAPDWVHAKRNLVVPNGVEFTPMAEGGEWRREHGISTDEFIIGMIGRIHPKKGIGILLKAMSRSAGKRRMKLILAGGGEPRHIAAVREEAERLGVGRDVIFVGLLEGREVAKAYAAIDLLALPSHEENFGNVVVEALAQDTPVVVSADVALAGWILEKKAGDVLPLNVEAWSNFLMRLPGKSLGKRRCLRKIAEESFEYRKVAADMLAAYRKILGSDGH